MMSYDSFIKDLSAFADPGTEILHSNVSDHVDIQMVRDGDEIRITLNQKSGKIQLRHEGVSNFNSMAGLLASNMFADIRRLSATQKQLNTSFDEENFIEAEGLLSYQDKADERLNFDNLNRFLLSQHEKLKIVLLDGQAGVGKTSLIRRLMVNRARSVNAVPIIHVESLGSRLFGLNQLLAAALDTLRAKFTFDQVPALVRNGLIQVAIDGFDELADSEGYADAWGALSDFLTDIGTSGGIILSGRDTFFDQQAFDEKLARNQKNVYLVGARLAPITPSKAKEYLQKAGWPDDQLNGEKGLGLFREESYILRPFFLSTLAKEEKKSWDILAEHATVRYLLVDRFLFREAKLIRQKTSLTVDKAKLLLTATFSELAMELSASEADAVDTAFIELMVETIFSDEIPKSEVDRLTFKAGSIALLEPDGRRGYRKFPHTEISNFFLAYGIRNATWSAPIRRVLSRANLLADFFSVFSEEFMYLPSSQARAFVDMIDSALEKESSSSERLNANLAGLWLASLSWHGTESARYLSNVLVGDAAIVGEASDAVLSNVAINRFDVRGTDISKMSFEDVSVVTMIVDNDTRIGQSFPKIAHIQVSDFKAAKNLRGAEIHKWLLSHQLSADGEEVRNGAEALLWRVASALTRRYVIRDSIVDPSGRFLKDQKWPEIEKILVEARRIERVPNRGGGPQDDFVRIFDPIGLMRREDRASRAIWEKVRSLG